MLTVSDQGPYGRKGAGHGDNKLSSTPHEGSLQDQNLPGTPEKVSKMSSELSLGRASEGMQVSTTGSLKTNQMSQLESLQSLPGHPQNHHK